MNIEYESIANGFEPFAISLYKRENLEMQGEKKEVNKPKWMKLVYYLFVLFVVNIKIRRNR